MYFEVGAYKRFMKPKELEVSKDESFSQSKSRSNRITVHATGKKGTLLLFQPTVMLESLHTCVKIICDQSR